MDIIRLRPGRLIDAIGSRPLENVELAIQDGRIKSISPVNGASDGVLELPDMTVLPGLIDSHTHLALNGTSSAVGRYAATDLAQRTADVCAACQAHLRNGVTTVRDLGGGGTASLRVREAIANGSLIGPRIRTCADMLAISGGHAYFIARQVDGAEEFRKAAREQIRAGADLLKVIATAGVGKPGEIPTQIQVTPEELHAVSEEARKAGRPVAVHTHTVEGAELAVAMGAHSLEHGSFLNDKLLDDMSAARTWLVPTNVVYQTMAEAKPSDLHQTLIDAGRFLFDNKMRWLEKAVKAGVRVAAGTDCGAPLTPHGTTLVKEIESLASAGMSNLDAIKAATVHGAELIGASDLGRLQPGALADVLVVRGDPVKDLSALRNVVMVFRDGRIVHDMRQH